MTTFLNSILNQSKKHELPFTHYEYHNALTEEAIEEIVKSFDAIPSNRRDYIYQ